MLTNNSKCQLNYRNPLTQVSGSAACHHGFVWHKQCFYSKKPMKPDVHTICNWVGPTVIRDLM